MNFEGGTIRYTIDVDSEGAERSFDNMQQKAQNLAGAFEELERGEQIESLQKGIEFLTKKLETLDQGTEEYKLTAAALVEELKELDEIQKQVEEEVAKAAEETRKAEEEMAKAAQAIMDVRVGKMTSVWNSFSKVATGAATALTTLATKGVSATNFLQTSQTAMSGLLGSMEEGKKAMGVAADFWSNNPFNRFDVTNATKQLVQYGRTVNQLKDDLYILKDVSLSTGMGIDELALRYGRVASSGRAMTLDIETMANRGVPIYRELAEILGTTQEGVREFASQGKIDFETFKKAMEGAADTNALLEYEKTLDRAKDKLSGSVTTLAGALAGYKIESSEIIIANEGIYNSWTKLLKAIAGSSDSGTGLRNKDLLEGLTKIGNAIGKIIDKLTPSLEPIFQTLGKIANFIGDHIETLIPIAIGALSFLTQFGAKLPIIGNLFGGMAGKIGKATQAVMGFIAKRPLLVSFIAILGAGFINLVKSDEEFRQSLSDLASAIGEIVKSVLPIIKNLVSAFMALANSAVVQGGLKLIVGLVARLAELISSIPTEVLLAVVAAIVAVKMSTINPWLVWITAIGLVIDILKDIAPKFYNAAHNAVIGFINGINEGIKKVVTAVRNLANAATTAIRNALGIHSPSKVMEGVGLNVGIGLADGITESSSTVDKAMNNLAKDVLSTANSVLSNKREFKLIDVNGLYKEWKKVANLFTIGSEQYEAALEKMEDARKSVNLEIINLQDAYNDKLDDSIDKIKNFYGLFDEVSTRGGKNANQIIKNLDKQVAQTAEWAEAQKKIAGLNLDKGFIKELQEMGVSSVNELSSIANMTADELEQLNSLWLQKQQLANDTAIEQLADYRQETLDQIDKLAEGIDGETVKVEDVGGRLVASIGEGITGAIPTLDSAFSELGSYIADASKGISGSGSSDTGGYDVPSADTSTNPVDNLNGLLGLGTDLKETATKWVSEKLPILIGIVGGALALKFIPKLKEMVSSGGGLLSGLKNILGLGKGASGITGAANALNVGSKVDLSGINKLTSSLSSAGKSMSKLDKVYLAIAKGAAIVLLIAADIWAISKAVRTMYDTLDGMEWGSFASKLGMMAAAIAAFALLDGIIGIGRIAVAVAIGGAIMLEIAVDIAAIATAIAYMDKVIPNDIDRIKPKLGLMVETILSFEVLTAIGGVLAIFEGLGILAIIGICGEIMKVAEALKYVNDNIPDDFGRLSSKIDLIKEVIQKIASANLGDLIKAIITSWTAEPVKKVANMYANVAWYLGEIGKIEIDFQSADTNISYIKDTIDKLQTETGVISGALNALRQAAEADAVEQSARILIVFGNVVDSLNKIATLNVAETSIIQGVQEISKCVQTVGSTVKTLTTTHLGNAENNVEKIKNIIEDFGTIAPTLNELVKGENKLNTTKVTEVIDDMETVFTHMKDKMLGMGSFTNRKKHVDAIKSIIEDFEGISKTVISLMDEEHKFEIGSESNGLLKQITDITKIINTIKENLYVKSGLGTVEKQMGEVQSMVNKFSEISLELKKQLTDAYRIDDEVKEKLDNNISNITNIIWEIEQINTSNSGMLSTKEWVVGMAVSIAKKFFELTQALDEISGKDYAQIVGQMTTLIDTLLNGVTTTASDKLVEVENVGVQLGTKLKDGILSVEPEIRNAGTSLQGSLWQGIQDKFADEYQQGIYLAYQVKDGIWSVIPQFEKVGADLQSKFWWGIQNKMNDEYNQGKALGNTFRQGLYDVDYANSGWWAVQGFINGAYNRGYYSGGNSVYWVGWGIANEFLRGLKERADEHSPWKTTEQSGKFAVQGLIDGMKSLEGEVINEAEVLADGITNALDLSDTSVSPQLNVHGRLAPNMYEGEGGIGQTIYINQTNNNYTDYDVEQNLADLSYELSKV